MKRNLVNAVVIISCITTFRHKKILLLKLEQTLTVFSYLVQYYKQPILTNVPPTPLGQKYLMEKLFNIKIKQLSTKDDKPTFELWDTSSC